MNLFDHKEFAIPFLWGEGKQMHIRSNPNFEIRNSPIEIRFTEKDLFVEVPKTSQPILMESFRFHNYGQFMLLSNTNMEFPCAI